MMSLLHAIEASYAKELRDLKETVALVEEMGVTPRNLRLVQDSLQKIAQATVTAGTSDLQNHLLRLSKFLRAAAGSSSPKLNSLAKERSMRS